MRRVKVLSLLLALVLIVSLLSGCGGGDSSGQNENGTGTETNEEETSSTTTSEEGGDKVTLTFWNGFTASDGEILRDIVERFNEENSGKIEIKMDIMPWDTFFQKLPPAIATDTAPSFVLMGVERIPEYVSNNSIQPLDDFWSVTGLNESNYVKNVLDMCKYQGKYYMMPMQYNLMYLYWNKDLFKEAGLDPEKPPETWEQLGEYAVKLTDSSKNQYGYGVTKDDAQAALIWGNGGEFWDIEAKKSLLNSEQNIKSYEWLQDLVVNKKVSPKGATGPDLDNLLTSGKLAMYINGPWLINGLKSQGVNFGITAPPKGSVTQASPIGGCGFAIPKGTPDELKPAIYEFVKYWLSQGTLKEWTIRNGFPPFSEEVINDPDVMNDDVQKMIAPLGPLGKSYNLGTEVGSQLHNDVIEPMLDAILMGIGNPADEVKKASDKIDQIFQTAK
jgi:multiple sugar transport system substrate-binding protein